MRIGSLCSGFGGLDLAAVAAFGVGDDSLAWTCETDPDASLVLKAHHPEVPNHGSIVVADWSAVEYVDVLTMGPPCQPISAAGRQRAEADPRWLWPDALRAIHALRPRGVVFENVRNLISIRKGEIWRGILGDFRDAGYAVRWLTLGACTVGAPHHRHRVFALAVRTSGDPGPAERVDIKECNPVRPLLPTPTARDSGGGPGHSGQGGPNLRTAVTLLPTPTARDGGSRGEGSPDYWAARSAVIGERWAQFAPAVAHWESVLGRQAPEPTKPGPRGGLRLTPELPEWMQGLPAGYLTDHADRQAALRLAGNGVCPRQGEAALKALLSGFACATSDHGLK